MIEVRHISRYYGSVCALQDLSFSAPAGQIVGLLGQNGAGKTTTLNILTGYLPPTSGEVRIGGCSMLAQPRDCKRLIGYLPEKPPLYDEMSVKGYLTFVCRLREVEHRAISAHVQGIMSLCGLSQVQDRLVGHLSKGYRQRVGIAQALCGDPPVIILDEPTVGLDPRQVVEIRSLIRRLGEEHTVIFSSHLLSEIQQLCSRAIILHKGRLIREADMHELDADRSVLRLSAVIAGEEAAILSALRTLPGLTDVQSLGAMEPGAAGFALTFHRDGEDPRLSLFRLMSRLDLPILSLTPQKDTLEEAFLRATAEE